MLKILQIVLLERAKRKLERNLRARQNDAVGIVDIPIFPLMPQNIPVIINSTSHLIESSLLHGGDAGRAPWLGWLRFAIFHHPEPKPRCSTGIATLY